jgi:hypothetical protein
VTGESRDARRPTVAEALILGLFLTATFAARAFLIGAAPPNPDEMHLLGGAYRAGLGQLPSIDYIEGHAPLLARVYAPLVSRIGERADVLDPIRRLHWGMTLGLFVMAYFLIRRAAGARVALWTVAIANGFTFFVLRTVHARPDLPALLPLVGAIWLVLGEGRERAKAPVLALVGTLFGVSISFHPTMIFPLVAVLLWIAVERLVWEPRAGVVRAVALVGFAAAATCAAGLVIVYGARAAEAISQIVRTIDVDRFYVARPPEGYLRYHVFLASPLPWIVVGEALATYHLRLIRRQTVRPVERLFLAMADLGILMLALRGQRFEQHFIFVALFGSVLAAARIGGFLATLGQRAPRKLSAAAALAALVFAVGSAVPAGIYAHRESALIDNETRYVHDVPPPPHGEDGSCTPAATHAWLARRPNVLLPFRYESRDTLVAQIRFLLAHSSRDEPVYTDWLNPPLRLLPVPYQHGLMISRYYASAALRDAPRMVAFLARYDPTFTLADRTEPEHFLRLFGARPPRLVLLQGSMARLFTTSTSFREWLTARYALVFDEPSGAFFAVRRDASEDRGSPKTAPHP